MLGQIIGHIKCALTPIGVPQGYIAKNKLWVYAFLHASRTDYNCYYCRGHW